jgi:hypothetical protein
VQDITMNQLHVKNHFVPQSYLKRWENPSHKVCVYKTLVSHANIPIWKSFSTAAVGYHRHLYTQVLNGEESDNLENWFSQEFESPASVVIEKATNDRRLSKEDWNLLIRFLAAQDARTPVRMLEHLKRAGQIMSDTLQNVLNEVKEKLENKDLDSLKANEIPENPQALLPLKVTTEFEHGKDVGILKAETYIGRSTWIHSIKHVLEHTEKILHTHQWTIVKPAKGYYWFTSDNPVIKLNYTNKDNYDLLGGWGKLKGNIIFPIGPEHAMFVQIGDKPMPKGTRLSVNQTIEFRKLIAENSHRMIFSHFEDNEIINFKKRVVNSELLIRENEEMQNWHLKNAEMEREYFKSKPTLVGTEK